MCILVGLGGLLSPGARCWVSCDLGPRSEQRRRRLRYSFGAQQLLECQETPCDWSQLRLCSCLLSCSPSTSIWLACSLPGAPFRGCSAPARPWRGPSSAQPRAQRPAAAPPPAAAARSVCRVAARWRAQVRLLPSTCSAPAAAKRRSPRPQRAAAALLLQQGTSTPARGEQAAHRVLGECFAAAAKERELQVSRQPHPSPALLHGDTFFLDDFAVRQWDDPNYSGAWARQRQLGISQQGAVC